MYVSSNQMCKSLPPKASHQLFISPLKELAVGLFHWDENGGTGRYQVSTGRSTPLHPVRWGRPRVLLESRVLVSNGYLQHTGRSAGPHWTRPVHTGLMHREFRKPIWSPDVSQGMSSFFSFLTTVIPPFFGTTWIGLTHSLCGTG